MSKYFISCFSGAVNMGDEFILRSLVEKIKIHDKEAAITVSSLNPKYTIPMIGNNIKAIEWRGIGVTKKAFLNMKQLKNAIKDTDYVIIGGGGLLQDVHSVATIPRYLISAVLAKYFDKKVIYYSMGVGPISNKKLVKLVRNISNNFVDHITVRDEFSYNYLKDIGVKTKIDITTDPVFSMSKFIQIKKKNSEKVRIGICFRQFKINKTKEHEIEKLITELNKQNKEIYLFPLDIEEDKYLTNRLKEKFDYINVIDSYNTIEDVVEPLSQMDFMISMRLHGIITCASYDIPSIAVSYDPKVTNIQSQIGMSEYLIDIHDFNSTLCLEKLGKLESTFEKRKPYFVKQVNNENKKIENSLRDSLSYASKNKKKVNRISTFFYFMKMFTPQICRKINSIILKGE